MQCRRCCAHHSARAVNVTDKLFGARMRWAELCICGIWTVIRSIFAYHLCTNKSGCVDVCMCKVQQFCWNFSIHVYFRAHFRPYSMVLGNSGYLSANSPSSGSIRWKELITRKKAKSCSSRTRRRNANYIVNMGSRCESERHMDDEWVSCIGNRYHAKFRAKNGYK